MSATPESPSFVLDVPDGVQIRDPQTGRVALTGETVTRAGFWARRLAAGEVRELVEPERAAQAAAPEPKEKTQTRRASRES